MMLNKRYLFLLLLFLAFARTHDTFAQFPAPGGSPSASPSGPVTDQPKGSAKITGMIADSLDQKPVQFASVGLYNVATGKAVDGAVADEKGKFSMSKLPAGTYRVIISFVGYRNKAIDNIKLGNGESRDLGAIVLTGNVKQLDEVQITGQAQLIEEKVDRLVYNADKDIMAKGGDAADVLRKVPLLTVDLDGNVTIRGTGNIKVLINNKPSTIIAGSIADALKQIPADQIKTVEVITSPSARYDAEGAGGIINIITKKNSLQGLNLNVDSGVGNRGSMLALNGNYRKGKAGVTLGGFGRANYNTVTRSNLDQTSTVGGVSTLSRQTGEGKTSGLFGHYNLGFDYDLAKNQSITAGVRYGVRNQLNKQKLITQLFTDGVMGAQSGRDVDTKNLSGTLDANVDYLYTPKAGRELSISTLYSRNDLTNNFDANILDDGNALQSRQRNLNKNVNQEFTLQTDYQTAIRKNQMLEFGGKMILRSVDSDYRYLVAGPTGDFVTENNGTEGALLYHQNIAAGYTSYTYTTKKRYTFKGGLRYEHTFIDASTREGGKLGIGNYGVLVPSLNVSKTFSGTTYKLAFNRRIQRPGLQQLNPNYNASNPQSITIGNPSLRPELTNNFELGVSRTIKKTFVNASFFGRITDNAITQVSQPSDTLAGAIVTTYQNVGKQRAYGTNIFANIAVTPKISIGMFINSFYTSLTGTALNGEGTSAEMTNSGVTVGGGTFASAALKNGWGIQAFGFMQGRQVQLQGTQGGFGFYSLGLKKDFRNKKGSVGLAAENLFANRFHVRSTLNSAQFNQVSDSYMYNRGLRMTFTYKLGKMSMNPTRRKTKSVKNDDVKGGEDDSDTQNEGPGGGGPPAGGPPSGGGPGGPPN